MRISELFLLPNLCSLSRILLIPLFWYFIADASPHSALFAATVLIVAGITDWLDGLLARRMGEITPLGIALDPIADKIFAAFAVLLLIFYRDFPVWLALLIIGRDLLILIGGSLLVKEKHVTLPSNLTGKYAFASIAILIGSYVIRFPFGIIFFTWLSVLLIAASLVGYTRVALMVHRGGTPSPFKDSFETKALRIGLMILAILVVAFELYLFVQDGGLGLS